MSRKTPVTRKAVSGVRALGRALNLSGPAAAGWVKHAEWPFGAGPWPANEVPLMARWVAEARTSSNATPPGAGQAGPKDLPLLSKARINKIVSETEGIKLRNKVLAGDYVDRTEAEARHCSVLEMIKRRLLTMPNRLPFDEAIKDVVRRHVREEFDLLAGGSK